MTNSTRTRMTSRPTPVRLEMHSWLNWKAVLSRTWTGSNANCPLSALRVTRLRIPSCQEVLKDVPERGKHFSKYRKDLKTLQQQFTTRFQDLVALQPRLTLFTDPLAAVPSQQPPDLQIELCALQSDPSFQAKRNEPAISFWKLVPRDPVSRSQGFCPFHGKRVWKHISMWEGFSTMKHIKSKERKLMTTCSISCRLLSQPLKLTSHVLFATAEATVGSFTGRDSFLFLLLRRGFSSQ